MWEALLPSLVSAGANIFGGMTSAAGAANNNSTQLQLANMNAQLQRETNAQNLAMFHENQDWQANMSNTAYQRQMADMKAAGLNPILAYQKGGGASSPSISTPQFDAPKMEAKLENTGADLGRAMGAAATSAMDTVRGVYEVKNAASNNALINEQTAKTEADKDLSRAQALKAASETDLTKEQIKNMPWLQDLLKGQTSAAHAAAGASSATAAATSQDARRKEQYGDSWIGGVANTLERVMQRFGPRIVEAGQTAGKRAGTAYQNSPMGPHQPQPMLRDDPNHWLYKKR